jgi:hypothetical protein
MIFVLAAATGLSASLPFALATGAHSIGSSEVTRHPPRKPDVQSTFAVSATLAIGMLRALGDGDPGDPGV